MQREPLGVKRLSFVAERDAFSIKRISLVVERTPLLVERVLFVVEAASFVLPTCPCCLQGLYGGVLMCDQPIELGDPFDSG